MEISPFQIFIQAVQDVAEKQKKEPKQVITSMQQIHDLIGIYAFEAFEGIVESQQSDTEEEVDLQEMLNDDKKFAEYYSNIFGLVFSDNEDLYNWFCKNNKSIQEDLVQQMKTRLLPHEYNPQLQGISYFESTQYILHCYAQHHADDNHFENILKDIVKVMRAEEEEREQEQRQEQADKKKELMDSIQRIRFLSGIAAGEKIDEEVQEMKEQEEMGKVYTEADAQELRNKYEMYYAKSLVFHSKMH